MKVKITVIADIEGRPDSDMLEIIHERMAGIEFVNDVGDVHMAPVIKYVRGRPCTGRRK